VGDVVNVGSVPGSKHVCSWSVIAGSRDVAWCCVQEPLMLYALSAVLAMEAHRADVGVVQSGLRFLANLSVGASSRVSVSYVANVGGSHRSQESVWPSGIDASAFACNGACRCECTYDGFWLLCRNR
jgi:hypothetical protein